MNVIIRAYYVYTSSPHHSKIHSKQISSAFNYDHLIYFNLFFVFNDHLLRNPAEITSRVFFCVFFIFCNVNLYCTNISTSVIINVFLLKTMESRKNCKCMFLNDNRKALTPSSFFFLHYKLI